MKRKFIWGEHPATWLRRGRRVTGAALLCLSVALVLLTWASRAHALEPAEEYAGLSVAPSGSGFRTNLSLNYLSLDPNGRMRGLTLWGAGDVWLGLLDEETIGPPRPSGRREIGKYEVGLAYERGERVTRRAWVSLGAGLSALNTQYEGVGYVDDHLERGIGETMSLKPHAFCALTLAGKGGAIRIGVDTRYRAFAGLFVRQ